MQPFCHVIIPVRNRLWTLVSTIQTVLSQDYPHFELIICDNFSNDGTDEYFSNFKDERVHYYRTDQPLGMSENFEFALSKAKGGWLAYLGADDGLLPGALRLVAELIEKTSCRAVVGAPSSFLWPNLTPGAPAQLTLPLRSGFEVRDMKKHWPNLVSGKVSFQNFPFLYTGGFVDWETVQQCRGKNGRFFQSLIPDIYSAVALGTKLDKFVYSYRPLTVSGISPSSCGAALFGLTKESPKAIEMLVESSKMAFDERLGENPPRSLPLLVFDSYTAASTQLEGLAPLDFELQLARTVAFELTLGKFAGQGTLKKFLSRSLSRPETRRWRFWSQLPKAFAGFVAARFRSLLNALNSTSWARAAGAQNIEQACWVAQGLLSRPEGRSRLLTRHLFYKIKD